MKRPCVRVAREEGEATRSRLADADLLDREWAIGREGDELFLPVVDPDAIPADLEVVDHEVEPRETQTRPEDLLDFEPTYERLGDLVLLYEEDDDRAREAAEAIVASDLTARAVLNRASKVKGDTRVREWEELAGNGTETVHREYGCEFVVDVARVYFSPRLATERHRVVEQVGSGERAFDMFAGVGPFAIPMAKRGAEVVATDVNEVAIEYLEENARRNGVEERVTAICGDVREVAPDYAGWADRVVMNLPHSADEFLDVAVELAGDECTLHYYDIQHEDDPFGPGEAAIREAVGEAFEVEVLNRRVVRSYAPHEVNVCLDVRLERKR
ncbi:MAG TPA: class I SAM-dependent methyltransferase family protein [Halobacteriales archaeon]|nr:class I SAM-dependent methyltransferase family protein [Halobacteriales archaeon]